MPGTLRGRPRPVLVAHGGCGSPRPTARHLAVLRDAIEEGYGVLAAGGSAVDAVERTVAALELSGAFNAGTGSVRQLDGVARMDAAVMDGRSLTAGAVTLLETVATPVRVARAVMEQTPHVLLGGAGARHFARLLNLPMMPGRPGRMSAREWRRLYQRLRDEAGSTGTVGAVARDAAGHVAAATSTGGTRGMLPGRIGDTPLIGAGTYADDRAGAVSMTGRGEVIIRAGLAREIVLALETGRTPRVAGTAALTRLMRRIGGAAGAIIVSTTGGFAVLHTTPHMASGHRTGARTHVAARGIRVTDRHGKDG